MNKELRIKVCTGVYILFLLASLVISFYTSYFPMFNEENSIKLYGEDFTNKYTDLQLHRLDSNWGNRLSYEYVFSKEDLPMKTSKKLALLVYRFASNGYEIYLNDQLIGYYGDIDEGKSNLWNAGNYFVIPESFIKDDNILRVESYAQYASGLPRLPFVISDYHRVSHAYGQIHLFNEIFITIGIGCIIFGAVLVILLSFSNSEHKKAYLYFGISAFSIGINAIDYLPINNTIVSHIVYKKLVMGGFYACAIFMTLALCEYFNNKKGKIVAYMSALIYLLMLILIKDNLFFNKLYSVFNASNLIHVLLWIYITAKKRKNSFEAKFLFIGFLGLIVFGTFNFISDINDGFFVLNTPLFYVVLIGIIVQFLVMMDFLRKEDAIRLERINRIIEYNNSITDSLTGVKNQRYILSVLNDIPKDTIISMIDIDDFKKINDNYGHAVGDVILKKVSSILEKSLDSDDIVCRYGGDEFIILHQSKNKKMICDRMKNILAKIESSKFRYKDSEVFVTLSVGIFTTDESGIGRKILEKLDSALYKAKAKGKNTVEVYS